MEADSKSGLYITAIVAIVAIVGITFLTIGSQRQQMVPTYLPLNSQAAVGISSNGFEDTTEVVGQAYRVVQQPTGYLSGNWNCYTLGNSTFPTINYVAYNSTTCWSTASWRSFSAQTCYNSYGPNSTAINLSLSRNCNVLIVAD